MTKEQAQALDLKPGSALCVIMADSSRWLGFFERSNGTHLVLRQSDRGTPPGFIQLPIAEVSEITNVILIRLGYPP